MRTRPRVLIEEQLVERYANFEKLLKKIGNIPQLIRDALLETRPNKRSQEIKDFVSTPREGEAVDDPNNAGPAVRNISVTFEDQMKQLSQSAAGSPLKTKEWQPR